MTSKQRNWLIAAVVLMASMLYSVVAGTPEPSAKFDRGSYTECVAEGLFDDASCAVESGGHGFGLDD